MTTYVTALAYYFKVANTLDFSNQFFMKKMIGQASVRPIVQMYNNPLFGLIAVQHITYSQSKTQQLYMDMFFILENRGTFHVYTFINSYRREEGGGDK